MSIPGTFVATAYGPPWGGIQGTGTTATGIRLPAAPTNRILPIVAVDPSVIPLGTKLKITPNPFGDPNIVFTAADTGGAIKGNRLDFLDLAGRSAQDAFGRQPVSVTVVGSGSSTQVAAVTPSGAASSASAVDVSAPGSMGSSTWMTLLLDGVCLAGGAALVIRGGRRALGAVG